MLCEGIDDGFIQQLMVYPRFTRRNAKLPCSENSMVGMALSASNYEVTTLVCLQRVEFALLAIEQLANNAAKNHYLTDGTRKILAYLDLLLGGVGSRSQSFSKL